MSLPRVLMLLAFLLLMGCSVRSSILSETVRALEEARLADQLESSEHYYIGRAASAVVVDAHPLADLKTEAGGARLVYLNLLGRCIEAGSRDVTRSATRLGNFVKRSADQQAEVDNLVLFKGVQVGLLAGEQVAMFATDGGFIWLSRGALELCSTEDELAALLAMQLGHVLLNHPMECYRVGHGGRIIDPTGERADWFVGDSSGANFGRLAISLADDLMEIYYASPYNLEADRFAALSLLQNGYEPRALVALLARMAALRFDSKAGDWLQRQTELDARVASLASFIDEHEMRVAPSWADKADFRHSRFTRAMDR